MVGKTELRVFVASPGGLEAEKDVVDQVASELNATLSDQLNVTLAVRRYEQLSARGGRPQSQINPWVDDCDVLIAIVHRRWGSPSGEGNHTGFSEESFRARARFESTGAPVVSLHFKRVDPESEADPGEQLAQVIAFREQVEKNHVGSYGRFVTADEFRANIMKLLIEEMFSRSAVAASDRESASGSNESSGASAPMRESDRVDESGLALVLTSFAAAVSDQQPENSLDPDRLLLFAVSVAVDADVPATHLANRLFQRRRTVKLSEWEVGALFESFLADHGRASSASDRTVPFWLMAGGDSTRTRLIEGAEGHLSSEVANVSRGFLRLISAFSLRRAACRTDRVGKSGSSRRRDGGEDPPSRTRPAFLSTSIRVLTGGSRRELRWCPATQRTTVR